MKISFFHYFMNFLIHQYDVFLCLINVRLHYMFGCRSTEQDLFKFQDISLPIETLILFKYL